VGRKKLPDSEKKDVVGISLPPHIIQKLRDIGQRWNGMPPSGAGRELLLLGLALVEGMEKRGLPLDFLNMTAAYRKPLPDEYQEPTERPWQEPVSNPQHSPNALPLEKIGTDDPRYNLIKQRLIDNSTEAAFSVMPTGAESLEQGFQDINQDNKKERQDADNNLSRISQHSAHGPPSPKARK
jgi:hypothetical protein